MEIPVTLLYFDSKAANQDGNYVPAETVKEYLKSPRWRNERDQRIILISVTHSLRNEAGSEPGLGANDKLLKEGVIIGYLKDCWISKDGKSWEGTIVLFDDLDQYSDEQKSMIMQILRLCKNGVAVQVSCCLSGDWSDMDGRLDFLDSFVGLDFTLNGAFSGARTHPDKIKE